MVAITLRADKTMQNFLGGGELACFQAIICILHLGSKHWSQDSSKVSYHNINLSEFLLNSFNERADALTPSAFWSSENTHCTHLADTYFIIIFSLRIECTLLAETQTASAVKWTASRRSLRTSLLTSTLSSSTEVDGRLQRLMDFGNYWSRNFFYSLDGLTTTQPTALKQWSVISPIQQGNTHWFTINSKNKTNSMRTKISILGIYDKLYIKFSTGLSLQFNI